MRIKFEVELPSPHRVNVAVESRYASWKLWLFTKPRIS